jgi:hypothetical protein
MENIKCNDIYEYELLSDKIVFVDGVTRTGKGLLSNLLLGFENLSSIQFLNILEQLMPMYVHDKISKNVFSSYFRLFLNENFYNYKLSRNLNFRYDDLTSIHNTDNVKEFYKNLNKSDGDTIIEELNNNEIYFQYQTHDLLTHYSKFSELNVEAYIIELFRHPIDTVHSWYMRGWGKRFDNADPRNCTTLFKYKNNVIPHYMIGKEEEYLSLNEMEKCIFMHNYLVRKSIEEYNKLPIEAKKKFLLIKYEDILTNIDFEMNRISEFLGTKRLNHMYKMMKQARVPREISVSNRNEKLEDIKQKVNKKYFEDLISLSKYYENQFYEL